MKIEGVVVQHRLAFRAADVKKLVKHAKSNTPRLWEGEIVGRGLLLAFTDDGVFLMSNSTPCMPETTRAVYAKGFGPHDSDKVDRDCLRRVLCGASESVWTMFFDVDDIVVPVSGDLVLVIDGDTWWLE